VQTASAADRLAARLVEGTPLGSRSVEVGGVTTNVVTGGAGPPIVLLHGEAGFAEMLVTVATGLADRHLVVAPDLPGLGRSGDGVLPASALVAWVGDLIAATCDRPPVLVGAGIGGGLAARFGVARGHDLARLVLVDATSIGPFRPSLHVVLAWRRFARQPDRARATRLARTVAFDADDVRAQSARRYPTLQDYLIERVRRPDVRAADRALWRTVGTRRIPDRELLGIAVPVSLIWGRHDRVTPLAHAERASATFGWPLHVIDRAGHLPFVEQPAAFTAAFGAAAGNGSTKQGGNP
jgi:pimeloyl-ACP methyl ester carboxylesterase